MADRIFAAKILVTGAIAEENREAFPEASEDLREAHAGGLVPFDVLREILTEGKVQEEPLKGTRRDIWIQHGEMFLTVRPDGIMEIGLAGGG